MVGLEEEEIAAWSALWCAAVAVVGRGRRPCRKSARRVRELTTSLLMLMRMYTSNEPPGGIRFIVEVYRCGAFVTVGLV